MTGMFFDNGRIYYTVSGNPRLYYRYFTPESQVVGANLFVGSSHGDDRLVERPRDDHGEREPLLRAGERQPVPGRLDRRGAGRSAGRRSEAPAWTGSTGRPGGSSPSLGETDTDRSHAAGPAHGQQHRVRLDRPHVDGLWDPSQPITYRIYRDGDPTPVGSIQSSSTTTVALLRHGPSRWQYPLATRWTRRTP